jgi:drug/metabolite transporter (DMT)-like permease
MSSDTDRLKATQMLVLATALWGLSFPTMKALTIAQIDLMPDRTSWFLSSLCNFYRFGLAAIVMLIVSCRTLRGMTRLEFQQGIGLGFSGGLGILFQMDGLAHTSASTSAFLTQCYCLLLPIWVAIRDRRWPKSRVFVSSILVIIGVAVLAKVDWQQLRLGRGELETIIASVFFTGQILWLERPQFARNNVNHFSLVMFVVTAIVCLPVAVLTTKQPADWLRACNTLPTFGFLMILVTFCTLGAYVLMNHWQRHVGPTLAGLLYCIEPVFASAFALFLPALFSQWAGINYGNETLTANLLFGGGLITIANVFVQMPADLFPRRATGNRSVPQQVP